MILLRVLLDSFSTCIFVITHHTPKQWCRIFFGWNAIPAFRPYSASGSLLLKCFFQSCNTLLPTSHHALHLPLFSLAQQALDSIILTFSLSVFPSHCIQMHAQFMEHVTQFSIFCFFETFLPLLLKLVHLPL